ncbi:MAG: hypothetical protein IJ057_00465 [Bacteroidales bacterium]|nr:hypothetical protein [Bacteroidales bacterium]
MNEENEMNTELKQLLDALEQHGKNARRQKQLGELIDSLEALEGSLRGGTTKQSRLTTIQTTQTGLLRHARNDAKRRKLYPLWWALGAAAACLLLWLVIKPSASTTQEENEPILAEQTQTNDSVAIKIEEKTPQQETIIVEEPMAEVAPTKTKQPKTKVEKPMEKVKPILSERPLIAEAKKTETIDSILVTPIETATEIPNEPLAMESQKPLRKVIKSESLVGYGKLEKQPENKPTKRPVFEDKTLFGQPQDPNMKNGMLALEIKF